MKLNLPPESWARVIVTTIVGTAICIATAFYVDSFNFEGMTDAVRLRSMISDLLIPTILAVPAIFFLMSKLRELAIAHRRLAVYAATDGLTQVMNRSAFSTLVEAYLTEIHDMQVRGALLIIDADNFKAVNDRYGHDRGDEALITIAKAIKSILRAPDIVGRIGGEEFGVFLPGATADQAETVAERIRQSVSDTQFLPAGAAHQLSVSVGGAIFDRPLPFSELFRFADQQLYQAKRTGRDRVALAPVGDNDNSPPLAIGA
jgi:diguanylate cyclase (GGDEF)-like protein